MCPACWIAGLRCVAEGAGLGSVAGPISSVEMVSGGSRPVPGRPALRNKRQFYTEAPMKAFVMKEIGRVGFVDKPVPKPGPNDAVVHTSRALICTSDSHTVGGGIGPRQDLTL